MAKKSENIVKAQPSLKFDLDGKSYEFVAKRFVIGGKEVLAEEALEDLELLAELVAIQSGVINLIEEND